MMATVVTETAVVQKVQTRSKKNEKETIFKKKINGRNAVKK